MVSVTICSEVFFSLFFDNQIINRINIIPTNGINFEVCFVSLICSLNLVANPRIELGIIGYESIVLPLH